MSFSTNVLAITKDAQAHKEKAEFENEILPISMKEIETIIQNTQFFIPEKYSEFISKLLNVIVLKAKNHGYRLRRLGQSEKHIFMNQLEFVKEK